MQIRRSQWETRFEMTPLMDVIFLLLTFFLYSYVVMIPRPNILSVDLPKVTAGTPAKPAQVVGLTLTRDGKLYMNTRPATLQQVAGYLAQQAKVKTPPQVYLAMEAKPGSVDRGPEFLRLIETVRQAGIANFNIVGMPEHPSQTGN